MSGSRFAKISDFCQTGSGTTPSRQKMERYYGGKIPWVKSGELRESEITQTDETITEAALQETSLKIVPAGALLVAMYGATVGRVGRLGIAATTNQAICHIVPDKSLADPQYMFHALCAKASELVAKGVGGAQPNISQGTIKDTEIFLPPLDEQKRIAAILDQADELRRKRQRAIDRLNQLGEAIFFEMFGDPKTNPHGFPTIGLGNLIKVSSGSGLIGSDQNGGEYPVYGGNGVNGWHDDFTVPAGTIVIGRVGVYCGAVHVTDRSAWVTDNALVVSLKRPVNPSYLAAALKIANLNQYAGRSAQPLVSGSRIYPIEILDPPIDKQNSYESKIRSIDATTTDYSYAKSALDSLFSALQHRAFQGEL